jgi:hypothetical protein
LLSDCFELSPGSGSDCLVELTQEEQAQFIDAISEWTFKALGGPRREGQSR